MTLNYYRNGIAVHIVVDFCAPPTKQSARKMTSFRNYPQNHISYGMELPKAQMWTFPFSGGCGKAQKGHVSYSPEAIVDLVTITIMSVSKMYYILGAIL